MSRLAPRIGYCTDGACLVDTCPRAASIFVPQSFLAEREGAFAPPRHPVWGYEHRLGGCDLGTGDFLLLRCWWWELC